MAFQTALGEADSGSVLRCDGMHSGASIRLTRGSPHLRLDDICARVVDRQPQSRHVELDVSVSLDCAHLICPVCPSSRHISSQRVIGSPSDWLFLASSHAHHPNIPVLFLIPLRWPGICAGGPVRETHFS